MIIYINIHAVKNRRRSEVGYRAQCSINGKKIRSSLSDCVQTAFVDVISKIEEFAMAHDIALKDMKMKLKNFAGDAAERELDSLKLALQRKPRVLINIHAVENERWSKVRYRAECSLDGSEIQSDIRDCVEAAVLDALSKIREFALAHDIAFEDMEIEMQNLAGKAADELFDYLESAQLQAPPQYPVSTRWPNA